MSNESVVYANVNELEVAESLIKKYPNSLIFGDYARALKTNIFTSKDQLIIITDEADLVISAITKLRTKVGIFRNTLKTRVDNSVRALIVCSETDEEQEYDIDDDIGYLSKEEWKLVASKPDDITVFRTDVDHKAVPSMAKVVWEISCFDVGQFAYSMVIHVVRNGVNVEEYAKELAKQFISDMTLNLVYIKNDSIYGAHPLAIDDLNNHIVRKTGKTYSHSKVDQLKKLGWQIASASP